MSENLVRAQCVRCAVKHIGQCRILLKESRMGYPLHVYYAASHLAEAADEIVDLMPTEANKIRDVRIFIEKCLQSGDTSGIFTINFDELIMTVAREGLLEETQGDADMTDTGEPLNEGVAEDPIEETPIQPTDVEIVEVPTESEEIPSGN